MALSLASTRTGIHSLKFNAAFLVFSRTMEKALRFVYLMFLARLLSPEALGLYNYGLAWYLIFLPLVCWGLGELLAIYLGRKPKNAEEIIGATLSIRLVTTIVFSSLCLMAGLLFNQDPLSKWVIGILVFALIGRSFAMWGRACFIAVEMSHYSAFLEIGFRFAEVTAGMTYLLFNQDILVLCAIHSAFWILEGAVAVSLARKKLNFRKIHVPWTVARTYTLQALPIAINIFVLIAFSQCGFVVLKYLADDAHALGLYTVAFQLVVNTVLITEAFGQAALPILSRADDRGSGEQMLFLEAMLKTCLLFSAALICLVVVYGRSAIQLLFGSAYADASDALLICTVSMAAYYALPFANEVLRAGFKLVPMTINISMAMAVNLTVSIALVPSLGEKAPALGLAAGSIVALCLHIFTIHRTIRPISWWGSLFKPMLILVFSVLATLAIKPNGAISVAVGLTVLLAATAAFRVFTPREAESFLRLLPRSR